MTVKMRRYYNGCNLHYTTPHPLMASGYVSRVLSAVSAVSRSVLLANSNNTLGPFWQFGRVRTDRKSVV